MSCDIISSPSGEELPSQVFCSPVGWDMEGPFLPGM